MFFELLTKWGMSVVVVWIYIYQEVNRRPTPEGRLSSFMKLSVLSHLKTQNI